MARRRKAERFVLCISNKGYGTALVPRKVYETVEDEEALASGLLRVIDESGEDYLFPTGLFTPIKIPDEVGDLLAAR